MALAPLTHAAGVLCFPVMTLGGEIVIIPAPDLAELIALAAQRKITRAFLPPTLIYMLLGHPDLPSSDGGIDRFLGRRIRWSQGLQLGPA